MAMGEVHVKIKADTSKLEAAFRDAGRQMSSLRASMEKVAVTLRAASPGNVARLRERILAEQRRRRGPRRTGPPPLCIDGAAYRRRRRARARRGR